MQAEGHSKRLTMPLTQTRAAVTRAITANIQRAQVQLYILNTYNLNDL